jgi:hypothetical protein
MNVDNKPKFRVYELPITKMTLITEYDPPSGIAVYHLSTFADIGKPTNLDLHYHILRFIRC